MHPRHTIPGRSFFFLRRNSNTRLYYSPMTQWTSLQSSLLIANFHFFPYTIIKLIKFHTIIKFKSQEYYVTTRVGLQSRVRDINHFEFESDICLRTVQHSTVRCSTVQRNVEGFECKPDTQSHDSSTHSSSSRHTVSTRHPMNIFANSKSDQTCWVAPGHMVEELPSSRDLNISTARQCRQCY